LLFWKQRVARHGIYLQGLPAYSSPIMKNTLVLTIALLGAAANIAWAGSQPSVPSSPSHPPLQCACVIGDPVA
jgi:hypothetical protein